MTTSPETPFDTIESAHDFVRLLGEVVEQAKQEIENEFKLEENSTSSRHRDALLIASYNLEKLEMHMKNSGRILNDLRSLRRLLYAQRSFHRVKPLATSSLVVEVPALLNSLAIPKPPRPVTALPARTVGQLTSARERAIPA
jgi:hypothetical protein